ncbi:dolichyl-phosphate-mannose-protein mannosyltransferase [Nematocida sp. AWRm77]|nr:dolichyl-phosphate-mannose-protein mannosyltransferase [Nematocida sp. AWRm77]
MRRTRMESQEVETQQIDKTVEKTPKKRKEHTAHRVKDLFLLWAVSFLVRVYRAERGGFVLWDEAHFGKFATHYLKREFFFDVHPPLGKLLSALSAHLSGIASGFSFTSEEVYPTEVDYGAMRIFHSVFGSFIPLLVYFIVKELGYTRRTANVIACCTVFDNALVAVSRLVLLDPFLVLFIMCSELFLCRVVMDNTRVERLSPDLFLLGVCIGLAASVKWIGLLTVAHVGVFAAFCLLSEIRRRTKEAVFLFVRLAACLIAVPVAVYLGIFYLHFHILNRSGPGDGDMSSAFQATLEGNEMLDNAQHFLYGNKVSVRSAVSGAGLLHSHRDRYPTGEQQVTTYPHKDSNNHWRVLKVGTDPERVLPNEELVLHHTETDAYLAVENRDSPVSLGRLSVARTREEMGGSILGHTVFVLETEGTAFISPITTLFYIKNKAHNCYLSFSGKKLPKWGFSQGEVVCVKEKKKATLWNIEMNTEETNTEESLEEQAGKGTDKATPPPPRYSPFRGAALKEKAVRFLHSVVELNIAMNTANNSLVNDGTDTLGTTPSEWLFPKKWLKLNRWDGSVPRFAMMGNPFTWYLGTLNLLSLAVLAGKYFATRTVSRNRYLSKKGGRLYIMLGGWAFHYFPFFLPSRILYLHHYLPSLLFSLIGLGAVLNRRKTASTVFLLLATACFFFFSSITYGHTGPLSSLPGYTLLKGWNIYRE